MPGHNEQDRPEKRINAIAVFRRELRSLRGVVMANEIPEAVYLVDRLADSFNRAIAEARLGEEEDLFDIVKGVFPHVELLDAHGIVARWDRAAIRAIVSALVANAHKHGAPPVNVSIGAHKGRVHLEVRDGGTGFTPGVGAATVRRPGMPRTPPPPTPGRSGFDVVSEALEEIGSALTFRKYGGYFLARVVLEMGGRDTKRDPTRKRRSSASSGEWKLGTREGDSTVPPPRSLDKTADDDRA